MASLAFKNLTFFYPSSPEKGNNAIAALHDVTCTIPEGAFVTLYGGNGSGKSTLLRLCKREIAPRGTQNGEILLDNVSLERLSARDSVCRIGYVAQQPEEQIVTDRVWHELAFGMENLGFPREQIRRRVAEIACWFGIEEWFDRETASLSGGQKQLLNLAAVMTLDPDLLLLDEPTAQLDPIAAVDFLAAVARLQRTFSVTVLLAEHRLEEALPYSDSLMILEHGYLLHYGSVHSVMNHLKNTPHLLSGMPAAVRMFAPYASSCPLTIQEGRTFLHTHFHNRKRTLPISTPAVIHKTKENLSALSFDHVWFRYEKNAPDVLRELTFSVQQGEIFCILGGNGSGKSTLLHTAVGWIHPHAGQIRVFGKRLRDYSGDSIFRNCISFLPQDVQTLFLHNTVAEELKEVGTGVPDTLAHLAETHPYDLSGGERQQIALEKVLASKPRLLLLDEPTKGLDAAARETFSHTLRTLQKNGVTIICVTHDMEFAAEIATRCALFFRGTFTSIDTPRRFFSDNRFYTTAVSRITRGYFDEIVTIREAEQLCKDNGVREDML